jgi:hypothetical protein
MLASIFTTGEELWKINLILMKEDDVEIEDEDELEDEESKAKEKTPDLNEDIFKDDEDAVAIAECF